MKILCMKMDKKFNFLIKCNRSKNARYVGVALEMVEKFTKQNQVKIAIPNATTVVFTPNFILLLMLFQANYHTHHNHQAGGPTTLCLHKLC